MKRAVIIITLLAITPLINTVYAQEEGEQQLMFTDESVTRSTNLHYTGEFCSECHEESPEKGGEKFLMFSGNYNQLCRCHGYTSENYIHPVNIEPSEEKKEKIPDTLPLQKGNMTCSTCHDIYLQCQRNMKTQKRNKFFLRGAPYARRTDLCFRCHDEAKYKRLDPHNQMDEDGEIIAEKCLYCHVEKPDVRRATYKKAEGIHGEVVELIGNLEVLCYRCHYKQSILHPINANHLRKPSEKTMENMKESEKQLGIILPLNYEGKITCATCHNPHERGVIPTEKDSARGASEKFRLRVPGQSGEICSACHKDKFKTGIGSF
jgi:hypothetical protein